MKPQGNALVLYNEFVKHKQLTDMDLARLCDINPNSIRSARQKLEKMRLIKRTDFKKDYSTGQKQMPEPDSTQSMN
jgi:transcription initiation factor IIE alpha subunit